MSPGRLIRLADTVSLRTTRQGRMGHTKKVNGSRSSMIITDSIQHYQLLCDALTNFTPCMLQKSKDEYGDTIYWLLDGCGDPDGDYFESLIDVEDYICNNVDIETYIGNRK
ncbi:hypothetical protein [Synechococcus phage S-B28]|uniref:Uncharacterized protein n=1 Tax=Synechococcus phage S-B28 TaxID=2545435 RepID=A0A482IEG5_9CAUD|nr:hypothetical protein HOV28_gp53 [Synechococcus phage S-B28]QBP05848.1 hypothetical protein [Synechococcus phage S-B28]